MIRLGIGKQIIIIALLPALIVATLLSSYYMWIQFNSLSESLNRNGELIARQLAPVAEYAVYSGNTEFIAPLANTILKDEAVLRIQILDNNNNRIFDIQKNIEPSNDTNNLKKRQLIFIEPIISAEIQLEEDKYNVESSNAGNIIGKVIITVTTKFTRAKQTEKIQRGIIITLFIVLLTALILIRISNNITRPIKSLTQAVRAITSGNLDLDIALNSTGELGILESCINQMKGELKISRTDHEMQLDVFTKELQQTLEELEIRNAELDITRSKAISASKAKSEFLANMSHEIRTPLSGIIGFTELLQGTALSKQQKDHTYTIQKSSKNLLQIINDILDLSKIESGKTEIANSEFNIIDIIEDTINLLTPVALEKNIELFYRIDNDVPDIVTADPFHIHQVLTNLVGNAIKFTEEGYVYLQVTTGEWVEGKNSIKFTVTDTGIGMSKNDRKKLFKAFTQADTSITRRFGGTGLGLVISRKLTLLMQGEIGFDSSEGQGSTFWFNIPVIAVAKTLKKSKAYEIKIALISNHPIAKQAFTNLLADAQYTVNNYSINELTTDRETKENSIENNNDVIVVFLSQKEIQNKSISGKIQKLTFSKPSLLIASTRSYEKLYSLQQNVFDAVLPSSEKGRRIKEKLFNVVNKNTQLNSKEKTTETGNQTDWSSIKVMVVDDNEINLRLAEIMLHKHKAQVTTARSGEQAIDYANMQLFDVIFMDLHMPGLDGYATTKKIRGITPGKQPVIIALTANALPKEKEKALKHGMNGTIIKPISDAILKKTMRCLVLKEPINSSLFIEKNPTHVKNAIDRNRKNFPQTEEYIFSIEIAKKFTDGNEELAYELFTMLRAELDFHSEMITIAIKNNNLKNLLEHVHKLHGTSRCCGTTELKNISSHIENLIKKNISFDIEKETRPLLTAMQNIIDYKISTQ